MQLILQFALRRIDYLGNIDNHYFSRKLQKLRNFRTKKIVNNKIINKILTAKQYLDILAVSVFL